MHTRDISEIFRVAVQNMLWFVPVAYQGGGGLGCSNPLQNSEDIGGVLDRISKKNWRLNFLL